jgi:hypothetical protein
MLTLNWLENPSGMAGLPDNVRSGLEAHGITEADFPEIAKAHPFTTFNLVVEHSGQCLAVPAGSQTVGQPVIQYPCLGAQVRDQGWRLIPIGNDLVQIEASHSGQCLAVPAGSQTDGQAVIQYPCLGPSVPDQSWRMVPVGGGRYQLRASHSDKCLAVPAGSQTVGQGVIQFTCLGTSVPDQLWRLRPISSMQPSFAALKDPAHPGDSNRFEFVKHEPYERLPPGGMPDFIKDSLTRKVVNSSTFVQEKSYSASLSSSGTINFGKLLTLGLAGEGTWTWTDRTSKKQSDGTSTTHEIKIARPPSDYTGSTFLHVFHDKLWKTYMFVLDDNF